MEMPCWCISEGHQHGGCKVTKKTPGIAFNLPSKQKVVTQGWYIVVEHW